MKKTLLILVAILWSVSSIATNLQARFSSQQSESEVYYNGFDSYDDFDLWDLGNTNWYYTWDIYTRPRNGAPAFSTITYTNMNAMEFLSDEYVSWDMTYFMNGFLLNRIPVIKKLKWREVLAFRGMWGHLSDKNNPKYGGEGLYLFPNGSYTFGREPYMEMGVGIENIFKLLRLDYVWRLTYKDHPDIQTHGVRWMMRLSF